MTALTLDPRFNGPPRSGNGGYTAGRLAGEAAAHGLSGPVRVTLRLPPPLGRPLEVVRHGEGVELRDGEAVVAAAQAAALDDEDAGGPVEPGVARAAEARYPGLRDHPFATCFVCGPDRAEGDGLRIFPGRLDDGRVAATWTPHPSVAGEDGDVDPAVVWAAVDCAGGWSSYLEHRPMVLGSMVAEVSAPVRSGASYVVVGRMLREEGRKTETVCALLDGTGAEVARSRQVWIAVDAAVLRALAGDGPG